MPQDPFKLDQLQVEPGSLGTRLIRRRVADGSLEFLDPVAGAPLSLQQLAGLNLTNLLIVGAGPGAQFTTIQSALDAIPTDASASNPYTVLIGPGVYAENAVLYRDGVTLWAFGAILNVLTGDALTIQSNHGTTPQTVNIIGLTLQATSSGAKALNATIASGGIGLRLSGCYVQDVVFAGAGTVYDLGSILGAVALNGTVVAEFNGTTHGTVTAAAGTALGEPVQSGSVEFASTSSQAVVFEAATPDSLYNVFVSPAEAGQTGWWITAKLSTGFTINLPATYTGTVAWSTVWGPGN
jgi:hypothetical protein